MSTQTINPCDGAPKTLDANGVSWEDRCNACREKSPHEIESCILDLKTEYEKQKAQTNA